MSIEVIVQFVLGACIGYIIWKFKQMETKMDNTVDEQEVRQIIEDKMEPVKVLQGEVKEDLSRIEAKLDRLIER